MNNITIKYTPFLLLSFLLLSLPLPLQAEKHTDGDILYSWVNDLSVRDKSGKTLTLLKEYESVFYLGKQSDKKESIHLREEQFNDFRYFVETSNGLQGWVYGGGLKKAKKTTFYLPQQALSCLRLKKTETPLTYAKHSPKPIPKENFKNFLDKIKLNKGKQGELIYVQPVFESGCLGTLHESCYANKVLNISSESGHKTIFSGDFPSFMSITTGMTKKHIEEVLGKPLAHNKNQYVYNSTEYNNHEDNVTYTLTIFYDEKAKVKSISVETFYHEDC